MLAAERKSGPILTGPLDNPQLESPIKLTVCYTETCNLACRICYADCAARKPRRELSAEQWIGLLDPLMDQGIISLYFEGGEPFHRGDFLDVLRACTPKAYCMVRTNATLIDAAMAAELRRIGVGTVLVDLWGARPETHDALTGSAGSHARSVAGIEALVAAGIPTQMLLILTRANAPELQDYVRLARRLGAEKAGFLRLYPLGRAKREWAEHALSLDEQMAALAAARAPEGLQIMQSWHPNNHNCCWQMAAVNAYGNSIGCAYMREYVNYGNLLETPLLETWDDPLWRRLRSGRVEKSCATCSDTQGSHGGCRSTAYAFHGRFDAPDPFDAPLNDGVDLRVLPDRLLQGDAGAAGSPRG